VINSSHLVYWGRYAKYLDNKRAKGFLLTNQFSQNITRLKISTGLKPAFDNLSTNEEPL